LVRRRELRALLAEFAIVATRIFSLTFRSEQVDVTALAFRTGETVWFGDAAVRRNSSDGDPARPARRFSLTFRSEQVDVTALAFRTGKTVWFGDAAVRRNSSDGDPARPARRFSLTFRSEQVDVTALAFRTGKTVWFGDAAVRRNSSDGDRARPCRLLGVRDDFVSWSVRRELPKDFLWILAIDATGLSRSPGKPRSDSRNHSDDG
jgi:hypothetical protein